MGRLEDLSTFTRVIEARSLSGAARRLGSTKSAVSKQVNRLEEQLGTRLLHRTTRSVSPTDDGRRVYERAQRMLEEAQALEAEVAGGLALPQGTLRLSTSTAFGNVQFTALMAAFCARHPQLHVVVGLNDRYVELAEEGFDVVLRLTSTPSPGLVARRLAPIHYRLCAAPAYLAEHGTPTTLDDLTRHRCLTFGYTHTPAQWRFRSLATGTEEMVDVQSALRFESGLTVNSSEALRVASLAGMGLAVLPTYAAGADIRAGRLVSLLEDWQPVGRPADADTLYAVYLPSRFPSPKVRALIDFMLEVMGDVPPWDRAETA
jgi:DNA-binding transcriptional LysR family regulator